MYVEKSLDLVSSSPYAALGLLRIHGCAPGTLEGARKFLWIGKNTFQPYLARTVRILQCISRCSGRVCLTPEIAERDEEELLVRVMLQTGQLKALATHLLHIKAIRQIGLPHAAVVRYILAQRQVAINLQAGRTEIFIELILQFSPSLAMLTYSPISDK